MAAMQTHAINETGMNPPNARQPSQGYSFQSKAMWRKAISISQDLPLSGSLPNWNENLKIKALCEKEWSFGSTTIYLVHNSGPPGSRTTEVLSSETLYT